MNKSTDNQKKLILIFKTFMEKSIIPQLKKLQGSLGQWIKLSSFFIADNLNYNQIQSYVDSLPMWGLSTSDKSLNMHRKSQACYQKQLFNPNKTFGEGDRAKLNGLNNQTEKNKQLVKQENLKQRMTLNNISIISCLQKLVQNLQQNQQVIQNLTHSNSVKTQQSSSSSASSNSLSTGTNQQSSQNHNYISYSIPGSYTVSAQGNPTIHANNQNGSIQYLQSGGSNGFLKSYF